ncbi:NADH-quinone oxidoreductase subunit J [Leptolyngbya sp. 15MV]|nr:NADH-quinone oxidoreductase subunit J [Leptolyngbya sp. 15MV]
MIAALAFYLFAAVLIAAAVMVVTSRNPVHSVLFLILAFFNAAALFLIAGAEFLAMILVIVYVGAVAVLFLFVVMMLDIDFASLRAGFMRNLPLGIAIALVLLAELVLGIGAYQAGALELGTPDGSAAPMVGRSNIESLGALMFGEYLLLFEIAGMILLVAAPASRQAALPAARASRPSRREPRYPGESTRCLSAFRRNRETARPVRWR